ncbi:hypothetical protein GGF44_000571 [Coemansia sp. RSA 1694]|nr:hypothetical protein GGF44_000571 [Coemansia sp. RSA 1694]
MAQQFFTPTAATIRHDLALDMSLKKLSDMKTTQRTTHRPANLLKTVLVYNMFKAAIALPTPQPLLSMEVDEPESGVAAEQSWFDRCIDNMLTEDSQESSMDSESSFFATDDDDDDDDDDEEEEEDEERSVYSVAEPAAGQFTPDPAFGLPVRVDRCRSSSSNSCRYYYYALGACCCCGRRHLSACYLAKVWLVAYT